MIERLTQKVGVSYRPEITAGSIIAMASQTLTIIAAVVGALFWLHSRFATIDVALAKMQESRGEIERRLQTHETAQKRASDDHDAIGEIRGDIKEIRAWIGRRSEAPTSPAPVLAQQPRPVAPTP